MAIVSRPGMMAAAARLSIGRIGTFGQLRAAARHLYRLRKGRWSKHEQYPAFRSRAAGDDRRACPAGGGRRADRRRPAAGRGAPARPQQPDHRPGRRDRPGLRRVQRNLVPAGRSGAGPGRRVRFPGARHQPLCRSAARRAPRPHGADPRPGGAGAAGADRQDPRSARCRAGRSQDGGGTGRLCRGQPARGAEPL